MKANQSQELLIIDCDEIFLREFHVEDTEDIYTIAKQPEVSKFLPDWQSTKEQRMNWLTNDDIPENKAFLKAASQMNVTDECLRLAVILKQTGKFIGWCCSGIKEELLPPNREVMYAISKDYQKRGYGTKACKGLIHYLFTETNVNHLNAIALVRNAASNKVVEKSGLQFMQNIEIEHELYNHYTLIKNEWIIAKNLR